VLNLTIPEKVLGVVDRERRPARSPVDRLTPLEDQADLLGGPESRQPLAPAHAQIYDMDIQHMPMDIEIEIDIDIWIYNT
jgi:hypothetical protein